MERYDLSNLDVLVVDRNQHMRGILRAVLSELGVRRMRDTGDPDQAFRMFKEQSVDLIFSDWVPGRDELKFLNKVRDPAQSSNPFVPVIIVTSYSEQQNVMAARDLGMTEFLAAPVSVKTIYDRICAVIRDKRSFINEEKFFGPDRRRHDAEVFRGEERRHDIEQLDPEPETRENGLLNVNNKDS